MGNIDRLLAALARQLPEKCEKHVLIAAIQAAAEALPDSHEKTRALLSKTQDACIEKLAARLKQASNKSADGGGETSAGAGSASAVAEVGGERVQPVDLYRDVSHSSLSAGVSCCVALLSDALMALRPERRAQDAIEGLLALFPPEGIEGHAPPSGLELDSLELCVRLVTLANALLGDDDRNGSVLWRRFLGFVLGAALRLQELPEGDMARAADLAGRLGAAVGLVANPSLARTALRVAVSQYLWNGAPPSLATLRILAAMLPPVVTAAFGGQALCDRNLSRGDLTAILLSMRLAGLCRAYNTGCKSDLNEVRDLLQHTVELHVDAGVLVPELKRMVPNLPSGDTRKALRRRVDSAGKDRAEAAALLVQVIEAFPRKMQGNQFLKDAASNCGLPVGEDEDFDARIASARARGENFFEDISGNTGSLGFEVDDIGLGAAASAEVSERTLEHIEGVESLKSQGPTRKAVKSKGGKAVQGKGGQGPKPKGSKAVQPKGSNLGAPKDNKRKDRVTGSASRMWAGANASAAVKRRRKDMGATRAG